MPDHLLSRDDVARLIDYKGREWAERFIAGLGRKPSDVAIALDRVLQAARAKRAAA